MTARLLIAVCVWALISTATYAAPKGSRWGADYFPNTTVTSQDGKTYRFYDDLIENKIVVINFIYTHCPDICGLQTARMAIVQDLLGERLGKDIFIYSISLDPKRDTPEVLKEYAAAFAAKPGWLFLTGDPEGLHKIRYKLGERSRSLAEHRNDAVLGNDKTGEWGRSSIMANLKLLAQDILQMDPEARKIPHQAHHGKTNAGANYGKLSDRHPGQSLFLKACAACHTIGMGDHIGPDLEGVAERRESEWLTGYLMAPDGFRKRGDPIALALGRRFKGVSMPNLSLSKRDTEDLISYVESQSKRLAGKPSPPTAKGSHAGHGSDEHGAHHKHRH